MGQGRRGLSLEGKTGSRILVDAQGGQGADEPSAAGQISRQRCLDFLVEILGQNHQVIRGGADKRVPGNNGKPEARIEFALLGEGVVDHVFESFR